MQIGSKVVCAFAGYYPNITTGKEYTINNTFQDASGHHITLIDDRGQRGSYLSARFMLQTEITKQVQENAQHG